MDDLWELLIQHVAKDLRAHDFHNRSDGWVGDEWHYREEAEKKIERMTRSEYTTVLGHAIKTLMEDNEL